MAMTNFHKKLMKDPAKAAKHFAEPLQAAGLKAQDIDGFIRLIQYWEPKTDTEKVYKEKALNNLEDRAALVEGVVRTPSAEKTADIPESPNDSENRANFMKEIDAASEHPVIGTSVDDERIGEAIVNAEEEYDRNWERAAQAAHVVAEDTPEQATLRSHLRFYIESILLEQTRILQGIPDADSFFEDKDIDQITDKLVTVVEEYYTKLRPNLNGKRGLKGTRTCKQCGVHESETLAKNPKYSFCKGVCVFCYNKNRSKNRRPEQEQPVMNSEPVQQSEREHQVITISDIGRITA